ncbi:hypothetical protein FDP41_006432 [Naegleria fowleri]|uniref:Uncharacterized protein n=1 Tax=Naegleria fowleri TaxID=5763 RepID=A0A6A5BK30_NAEFO|nr:uncharacterized protein FDP41_006432 [Naegleria fowleri]KAF0974400.1 hypothetical protein FDP41_006432 [Naegleria fowleri]CAG4719400.1 unnamed protein product [Naegleria fowleri]
MIWGSLARSGKVKYQTPRVPKTASRRYKGGHKKFRKHSVSNVEYKSGAHRLEQEPTQHVSHSLTSIPARLDERMNATTAPFYLSNSFHKYNSSKGYDRLEFIATKHEEKREKNYFRSYDCNDARNHKKWHRNHPQDGFYQMRETFDFANECGEDVESTFEIDEEFEHVLQNAEWIN